MVLMSAIKTEEPTPVDENLVWKFSQEIPIPSYLIAIAVGRLKGKLLGLKSIVYAEPEIVQECAFEFSEVFTIEYIYFLSLKYNNYIVFFCFRPTKC